MKFKTGDIVGFRGKSSFSKLIMTKIQYDISHVGVIVVDDEGTWLCESTTLSDIPDAKTGKIIKGVQWHDLEKRVKTYDGDVFLFPLQVDLPKEKEAVQWLMKVHEKETKYDMTQALFSGLYIKQFLPSEENLRKLFCSELCCKFLTKGDAIREKINPSTVNPKGLLLRDELKMRLN